MKYTTPALMNDTKKLKSFKSFFFGHSAVAYYYRARHKTDNVLLLWIEMSQFGKLQCFPCVLDEDGDAMVFEVMKGVNTKIRNAELIQRWSLFATPQNIREEYNVEEMEKNDFYQLFGDYRHGAVQKEIEKVESETSGETRQISGTSDKPSAAPEPAGTDVSDQPKN